MLKICFTPKVRYGEPGRAALGKKKKTIAVIFLSKEMRVGRTDEIPLVPENWDNGVIRERGEDCFREVVRSKQVDKHPCGEFPFSITKFGSNSLWVQGSDVWVEKVLKYPTYVTALNNARVLDVVRVSTKLHIHRKSRIEVWRAILARYVLLGCPYDGISSSVILYEITIVKGMSFPFASIILGSLYKSCGPTPKVNQHFVSSFTSKAFRDNYRAWAWHGQTSRDNILNVLDEEWTSFVVPDPKVQLHVPSINNNDMSLRLICFKRNKPLVRKSTSSAEMEEQDISKFKSEEESCDHTNDYELNDELVKERLPRHEYLSLGGGVDGIAIQEGLTDMIDFLLFTMQNVSGDDVNVTTRVYGDNVNATTRVSGDDVNAITEVGQSVLWLGFGTP
ncbi:Uncharacterized protein TCM_017422 [Theobroma cacao]|uniref:Uncharacterized protein n=1 Tax=Theobroma cacao TaxID=3641 RepID=A0A061EDF0_THECC|nr:Uncharacterized protein TCM_017422 [Theobroma cacao]